MPKIILRDVFVEINDVELSEMASSVSIMSKKDLVEVTTFGATHKENLLGLGDATIGIKFFQNFDAASVDATLWPLHEDSEVFAVRIKATSGPVSATNPAYEMAEAVLPEFSPLNGDVGAASTTDVTFQNAGQTGIARVTTA